jgi:hypothetical protein
VAVSFVGQAQFGLLENGNPHPRGSDIGFINDSPTRQELDLAGPWICRRDGGEAGTVKVPHSFRSGGTLTYEKTFTLTSEQLDAYAFHLVMFGTGHSAEISINGEFLTNHSGSGTSFVQPIPPSFLQIGGENRITIVVNNTLDPRKTLPLRAGVWDPCNYGGILRDAFLLATPVLYVKDVAVSSELNEDATRAIVHARVSVDGADPSSGAVKSIPSGTLTCVLELVDKITGQPAGRSAPVPLRRAADGWEPLTCSVTIEGPKIWSLETPDLYVARCMILNESGKLVSVVDKYDSNIGLRTLDVHNADFFLNGKRVILRGVVWYEDHPSWGGALTYEQMERDIVLIKNLGANAVRFAAHPPHPYMLNLCDRYGLLAFEEIPVRAPAAILGEEGYLDLATAAAREMILRDRNHPSVFAWGLGDQFEAGGDLSRSFVRALAETMRGLDGRPLYYSLRSRQADVCADLVDFVALNVASGDSKSFKNELEQWRGHHRDRPLVVLHLGTEVQDDNKNGYNDPLSQQAQARFYLQRFEVLRSLDFDGGFVWAFNDYRGDRPALTVHGNDPTLYSVGLVSGEREKRIAYDAVRSIFQNEKFVALPPGSAATTAPIIYVLSGFVLLVGLAYLYNTNRRFRESLNRSVFSSYNFFADVRDQHAVPGFHSTLLALIVAGASCVVLSSFLLHFRGDMLLDNVLSLVLISDRVKALVVPLVWDPLRFIVLGGAVLFLVLLGAVLFVFILRSFFKSRVFVYHIYTVTAWSAAPFVVLIPIGMILYRLLESSVYVLPALIVYFLLHLWVFLRLLKGLGIVFDLRPAKVYTAGSLLALGLLGGLYLYYDLVHSGPMYVAFWYHTLGG